MHAKRIRFLLVSLAILVILTGSAALSPAAASGCTYQFGFATLFDAVPDTIGACTSDLQYTANGDATQYSEHGMLKWRKADNWTSFTDGYRTWVLTSQGVQTRLNSERFGWEMGLAAETDYINDLKTAFQTAVKDAEITDASEISRQLKSVTPDNQQIVWRGIPGQSEVLVVSWTSYTGYKDQLGKAATASREIWVTLAPDLKQVINNDPSADKTLRAEQLLGLPPNNGKTLVYEMWVSPQDLFRPSPDPEITDHEAELDFPDSHLVSISPAHKKWINNLKASSYGDNGYPWTRLGYTYDWGNPNSEIGLSEFVVRQGASIEVKSAIPTDEYWLN
jgi:hypothetical protein